MRLLARPCILLLLLLPVFLPGCSLQKDVTLDLPPFESQLVVECYLEPGKPYRLTVFQSTSFFDRPEPVLATNVIVTIAHKERIDTLAFNLTFDQDTGKLYTHTSEKLTTGVPGDVYTLTITDSRGQQVTGTTTLLRPVPIDTLEWHFNERNNAYVLAKFQDEPNTRNFYRLMIQKDSLPSRPVMNFTLSDQLNEGQQLTFGTSYRFRHRDTLFVSLYHLEEQYYDFLSSVGNAQNANGNPFAQPARVKSSLTGGIGVFTNLSYVRKVAIIRK